MDLDKYIADEMAKYNGICFPLKSSMLLRLIKRREKCSNLHPNPVDEFCDPKIGPSYRIISEYEKKILEARKHPYGDMDEKSYPIIIEKMYPEGFIIVNGHHRWAASMRLQRRSIPVKVVNLTHENDIKKMLELSDKEKRVTLDLDEVVFGSSGDTDLEKGLPFPFNLEYKERLRSGIPALFNHLSKNGYDIWVYSANYYSMDYLKQLFKRYHVTVDGIVTGMAKKSKEAKSRIDKLIAEKYKTTIHIDRSLVLITNTGSKDFIEKEIVSDNDNWALKVKMIIDETLEKEQ